jgi:hypothetical protein
MAEGFASLKCQISDLTCQISHVGKDLTCQVSYVRSEISLVRKDLRYLQRKLNVFSGIGLIASIASILETPLLWELAVKKAGKLQDKLTNQGLGNTEGADLRKGDYNFEGSTLERGTQHQPRQVEDGYASTSLDKIGKNTTTLDNLKCI